MFNENLNTNLKKIIKVLSQKIKIIYDPEDMFDEYFRVPLLINLINSQKQIKTYDCEQNQVFIENNSFEPFSELISYKISAFSYKKMKSGLTEILFDTNEHMEYFLQRNSLGCSFNDHFIWKYEFKLNATKIFHEPDWKQPSSTGKSYSQGTSNDTDKQLGDHSTNTLMDREKKRLKVPSLLKSNNIYVLGPLKTSKNDLLHSFRKIDPKIQIKQFICPFGDITKYFILKFTEDRYIDALEAFLPHIQVEAQNLEFRDSFSNIDILNLNYIFPIKFRICDPVFISAVETRIVQLLNLFLPYEPDSQDIEELETELTVLFPDTDIYICFTDQNDNKPEYRSNGRVFIECKDVLTAKDIFNKLGGLIYHGRPIIATYYPELLFKSGVLSVFSLK